MTIKRYCRHCREELDEHAGKGHPHGDVEYRKYCDICKGAVAEDMSAYQLPIFLPPNDDRAKHYRREAVWIDAHEECYRKLVSPLWEAIGIGSWEEFEKWRDGR